MLGIKSRMLNKFRVYSSISYAHMLFDVHNSIFNGHLYLSGIKLDANQKMDTKMICVGKILDYMLKTVNHYGQNSQHSWRGGEAYVIN